MQVPAGKLPAAARAYPWMDPQGLLTITFHPVLAQPACLGHQFIHLFPAYPGLCLFRIFGPSQICNLLLYNKIMSVIRGPLSVIHFQKLNSPPVRSALSRRRVRLKNILCALRGSAVKLPFNTVQTLLTGRQVRHWKWVFSMTLLILSPLCISVLRNIYMQMNQRISF